MLCLCFNSVTAHAFVSQPQNTHCTTPYAGEGKVKGLVAGVQILVTRRLSRSVKILGTYRVLLLPQERALTPLKLHSALWFYEALTMGMQHMADGAEDERAEELSSISAIFPELVIEPTNPFIASLDLPVNPSTPLAVIFQASPSVTSATLSASETELENSPLQALDRHLLSFLPPLHLKIALPEGYPDQKPPVVALSSTLPWLPRSTIERLEKEVDNLWEDYGRGQTVFAYIDFLQQSAENGFSLNAGGNHLLKLDTSMRIPLLNFDTTAQREKFESSTFDCGVCLEPKKGTACYKMTRCNHVFCKACLQDFYNNAITEGDISSVTCLEPRCEKDKQMAGGRSKKPRTLPPGELLLIPIERQMVQRYVDMKRKKQLESDASTIYCPRQWCQGPARSKKYPKITDLSRMDSWEDDEADFDRPPQPSNPNEPPAAIDRLAICDDCSYAFCKTCLQTWHGEYVRCWPKTAAEISEDERLSYEYLAQHTSPCPVCSSPIQKTEGCNHMTCFQCMTHFCYLCGSWLDGNNPYEHFGDKKTECYGRLFDLVEGDNGAGNVQFGGARGYVLHPPSHPLRDSTNTPYTATKHSHSKQHETSSRRTPPKPPKPPRTLPRPRPHPPISRPPIRPSSRTTPCKHPRASRRERRPAPRAQTRCRRTRVSGVSATRAARWPRFLPPRRKTARMSGRVTGWRMVTMMMGSGGLRSGRTRRTCIALTGVGMGCWEMEKSWGCFAGLRCVGGVRLLRRLIPASSTLLAFTSWTAVAMIDAPAGRLRELCSLGAVWL